ncbi:hypothetical protein Ade02nite_54820 [Paractinoplanes deccanensis]|uniref:Uncharacterized protein n=1 Tax=Paractinoplanes deccanensis TaxID=113561 RepID=A0ABQ3YA39_9ACTN|nr:hypothetical protein [Actinoplanes deccanensis]GID76841.1 hypothetical protein Ade02nite_54820 [Actinoplanes deccanensis]
MTDHHDFGDHEDFGFYDEHPLPEHQEPAPFEDHLLSYDEDDHHPYEEPPVLDDHHEPPEPEAPAEEHTDLAADADPVDVFPPQVDVGDLPEPVDGFPWIDTGSLGVVPAEALTAPADPVSPQELAEYVGEQLPPGADPWAALADSEDPATSTLARWWQEN